MTQVRGGRMITLTRLDGKELVVNCDHILTVEATPDTVIALTNEMHFMVRESPDDILEKVAAWRRRCQLGPERRGDVLQFPRAAPAPTPEE
jgi:flagellar protein FlbD